MTEIPLGAGVTAAPGGSSIVQLLLSKHLGASYVLGLDLVHVTNAGPGTKSLLRAWRDVIAQLGLAGTLEPSPERAGAPPSWHAPVYPFLPLDSIRQTLTLVATRRLSVSEARRRLAQHGDDARAYWAAFAHHVHLARQVGWVAWPMHLGFYPAVQLGVGRHSRMLIMNVNQRVGGALTLAGVNKAVGRDFLAAHGLPVPPGRLVSTPDAAVEAAIELGLPVVLKRLVGGNSDGVMTGLKTARAVRTGAGALLLGQHGILVERHLDGVELRLHFVAGRLHAVFRATFREVVGDGRKSILALLRSRHAQYLSVMSMTPYHRGRLTRCLWAEGVRRWEDLRSIVLPAGRAARVSAATGTGMAQVDPEHWLQRADIRRLERLLESYGSPSCGIDLMMPEPRVPIDQGAIVDLNVPCGFGYLPDVGDAVATELWAVVRDDPAFRRSGGRVPVWLILEDDASESGRWSRIRRAFRRRFRKGVVQTVSAGPSSWWPVLTERSAEAFLLRIGDDAIEQHGLPANLQPSLFHADSAASFRLRHRTSYRTVRNAGGRLVPLNRVRGD